MSKSKKASEPIAAPAPSDHDAQYDLDQILRAEEIKSDPEKMERIKKVAGRKHKALSGLIGGKKEIRSIDDIRKASNEMAMKKVKKL